MFKSDFDGGLEVLHDILHRLELLGGVYNQLHNILRLLDVLPNFPFTTSETMVDYYL